MQILHIVAQEKPSGERKKTSVRVISSCVLLVFRSHKYLYLLLFTIRFNHFTLHAAHVKSGTHIYTQHVLVSWLSWLCFAYLKTYKRYVLRIYLCVCMCVHKHCMNEEEEKNVKKKRENTTEFVHILWCGFKFGSNFHNRRRIEWLNRMKCETVRVWKSRFSCIVSTFHFFLPFYSGEINTHNLCYQHIQDVSKLPLPFLVSSFIFMYNSKTKMKQLAYAHRHSLLFSSFHFLYMQFPARSVCHFMWIVCMWRQTAGIYEKNKYL